MQENRSFDHCSGSSTTRGSRTPPRAAAGATSNPTPERRADPSRSTRRALRGRRPRPLLERHAPGSTTAADERLRDDQRDGGRPDRQPRDGLLRPSDDVPFYYGLYATFAMGDRYFSSVLGPTYPNRFYLLAGTSFGRISNEFPSTPDEYARSRSSTARRRRRHVEGLLRRQFPFAGFFKGVRAHPENFVPDRPVLRRRGERRRCRRSPSSTRSSSATATSQNDEHPPANVQVGQAFVAGVIDALMQSPQWSRTALFLTYDEHGGFYDHVPPPAACVPDASPPRLDAERRPGAFDRYGIRVPMVVVSPYREAALRLARGRTTTPRSCASSRRASTCRRSPRATRTPTRCSTSSTSRTRRS